MSWLNFEWIGRAVMLVLGVIFSGLGIKWAMNGDELKRFFVILIMLFPIGLGAFGLPFINAYKDILKALTGNPGSASYQNFLTGVANGKVPPEVREAGLAFVLEHPIPQLGPMLDAAIKNAPAGTDPATKQALMQAKESYDRKVATAQQIETTLQKTGTLGPETLNRFDRTTRIYLAGSLLKLSDQELQSFSLNRAQLENMVATIGK